MLNFTEEIGRNRQNKVLRVQKFRYKQKSKSNSWSTTETKMWHKVENNPQWTNNF